MIHFLVGNEIGKQTLATYFFADSEDGQMIRHSDNSYQAATRQIEEATTISIVKKRQLISAIDCNTHNLLSNCYIATKANSEPIVE